MELEGKDDQEQWHWSLSPSIGEGLLRAANKEYLNNVNYHNVNTLQSPYFTCVYSLNQWWSDIHTDDLVPFG